MLMLGEAGLRRQPDADQPPYRFASFHATPEEVTKYRTNVEAMTISIRELAAITRVVFEAGLLY
jgi:hypothetical protein